jgi:hypothetical protein
MPCVQETPDKVVGIFASDLHLSQRCPPCRAGEPDWFAAMARPLQQLRDLQERLYNPPIIYPGDIWDHYRQPPEVINWAIEHLPHGIAIPGQHDLPHHNYADIKKSAYWTLVQAQVLEHLEDRRILNGVVLHGYPWGRPVVPREATDDTKLHIAVIHAYCWTKGHSYPMAPTDTKASGWLERLGGYDAAFFGDNHRGFTFHQIVNCGGFMRRRSDEIGYRPAVGLLYGNGRVGRYELDCSEDKIEGTTDSEENLCRSLGVDHFLKELAAAGDNTLDYAAAIRRRVAQSNYPMRARELLLEALDGNKPGTL